MPKTPEIGDFVWLWTKFNGEAGDWKVYEVYRAVPNDCFGGLTWFCPPHVDWVLCRLDKPWESEDVTP